MLTPTMQKLSNFFPQYSREIPDELGPMLRAWEHIHYPPRCREAEHLVSVVPSVDGRGTNLCYQWPLLPTGQYAGIKAVCLYMGYCIDQVKQESPRWPADRLIEETKNEFFPHLDFLLQLDAAVSNEGGGGDHNFKGQFCLGSSGLQPVIGVMHQFRSLISHHMRSPINDKRDRVKWMLNPYAAALRRLVDHLRLTCDRSYYDPEEVAFLRALLQDEGHRLEVSSLRP